MYPHFLAQDIVEKARLDDDNWEMILYLLRQALKNGSTDQYKSSPDVLINSNKDSFGNVIQVTYKIIDSIIHISDGWVN